jgi:DNA-binding MarR family transcriptional regulator
MLLTINVFNQERPAMAEILTREELGRQAIDRFWETIPPVWSLVRNHLRSTASEKFEISVEQFHILRHIRKGIITVSDLAEIQQISRPAISQGVDALVEKGLVSRRQDKGDRRFVYLQLTPQGDDLLNQVFQENRAWMLKKMEGLDPEQLARLVDALETLKESFANFSTNL